MAEPQALIVFGDGLQALFYDDKNPKTNREGIRVQPILVVPSEELKYKYKLTEEDLNILTDDNRKGIWLEYPTKQIIWLSKSKTGAVVMVFCAFDGGKTDLMKYYDELLEWDEQRDKTESRLRAQISFLNRELEDVTSNQAELMRKMKELQDIINAQKDEGDEND